MLVEFRGVRRYGKPQRLLRHTTWPRFENQTLETMKCLQAQKAVGW
jgi:hypothetical protein